MKIVGRFGAKDRPALQHAGIANGRARDNGKFVKGATIPIQTTHGMKVTWQAPEADSFQIISPGVSNGRSKDDMDP